ncbi:MAG: phosphate ABC transporter ATP-binding protein PstB [Candidatus Omnitrophica bacterium]|nr:phosphate ABC transporter ATP-binding protein PstB [Candidatus Omnitrophota bacterium]MCM8806352.1 phosphate ABC transporter ATP-binding protein PstB [Candidatus Omnitrophota bacterium]
MESKILKFENFSAGYGNLLVLKNINLEIFEKKITAIMGPSGCGKTTLIRCINRMHELNKEAFHKGDIFLNDKSIFEMNPVFLRRKIGMVFQKPNPFPHLSIYENVLAGYIINGIKLKREEKDKIVEDCLKKVALWEEVKDKLYLKGTQLSGGQQQRLCIARSLALNPEIILLDEPTSSLDPKSTVEIENLLEKLKDNVTIIIVTHNISQASRIADYVAFLYLGELIEYGKSEKIFTAPENPKTEEYLSGKFG